MAGKGEGRGLTESAVLLSSSERLKEDPLDVGDRCKHGHLEGTAAMASVVDYISSMSTSAALGGTLSKSQKDITSTIAMGYATVRIELRKSCFYSSDIESR